MTKPKTEQPGGTAAHADNPTGWIEKLIESLEAQRELYDQLDRLGLQQAELLEPESADSLLRLLGDRDAIIESLTTLNAGSKPLVRRWSDDNAEATSSQRDAVRAAIEHIEACMARITERDATYFATLQANRDKIAGELAGTNNARAAVSAYAKAGTQESRPRFKDQEG